MPTLLDTFASYVPALVVRHYRGIAAPVPIPASAEVQAALLFVDISGFTALAEQLGQGGPAGVENLSSILNTIFTQILDIIASHGGDVVKFAGDALLAAWTIDENESLALATLRATQCAVSIHERMEWFYRLIATVHLFLRIGVAVGDLLVVHLGGVYGRWEMLLTGRPLSQVAVAERYASPGDVVLAPEAWQLVEQRCSGVALDRDLTALDNPPFVRLQQIFNPTPSRPRQIDPIPPEIEPALRAYIPGAVLSQLVRDHTGWLAELRRITVLFVHLPDLGYANAIAQGQQVMETLQTTLYRYEGSVNKLTIDDKGVMLVAAFGLPPFAHEDDPARGVQAALAMQSAMEGLGLRCAIGVTTGRAFCGEIGSEQRREYTMIGDVVNLAARLMQAASLMSDAVTAPAILCDAATFGAVNGSADRLRITFETLPPFSVKGKSGPIPVYQALDAPESAPIRAPLHEGSTTLVGRAAERARLQALVYRLTRDQRGGTALITGDAGMGKSRLVGYVAHFAATRGVAVVIGGAGAVDHSTPYHAWRSVFAQMLGDARMGDWEVDQQNLLSLIADTPALLARLPLLNAVLSIDLADTPQTIALTGQARASATRDLLVQILQRLAAKRPYLIVLEDAHWLDSSSWALAIAVAQQIHSLALLITMRPLENAVPLEYQQLRDLAHVDLRLDALSPAESIALVCRRLGVDALPEAVADLIREKAQGNPFFSEELAYALRDAGLIQITGGVCALAADADLHALSFPETVQSVIISRIDRLTATQQLTLKVASVIGRAFPVRAVQAVYPTEIGLDHLSNDLAALVQLDITSIDESEQALTYSFKHAITQDVVYNLMLFSQRRRLHRAVAEWYEQTYPDNPAWVLPLLAYHWTRADVAPRAVDALERAGAQALRVCSFQEARSLFEQAVTILRGLSKRELADRYMWQMSLMRQLGDSRQYLADFYGARSALEESLHLARNLDQTDGAIAALSRLGRLATDIGDYQMAQDYLEEGLLLAREADAQDAVAYVLNNLGNAAFRQGNYVDAITHYQECLAIQLELRDDTGIAFAFHGLGNTMASRGAYNEATYFYEESLTLRRRLGDRWGEAACLVNLGWVMHLRGDYALARSFYDDSLAIYRSLDDQRGMAIVLNNLGFTMLELNNDPLAATYLFEALRIGMAIGTLPIALESLVGLARWRLRDGAPLAAAEWLGLATSHSAANVEVQLQADRTMVELRPALAPAILAAALKLGGTHHLEDIVASILNAPSH